MLASPVALAQVTALLELSKQNNNHNSLSKLSAEPEITGSAVLTFCEYSDYFILIDIVTANQ